MRRAAKLALAALWLPAFASAGPPFLTDDPEPTDTGHWEIYAPLIEVEGEGEDYEGAVGFEINYGAAADLQLTIGLPAAFMQDNSGSNWGVGDLELSAKYRFYHDESAGLSIAAFPGVTLPTASRGFGADRVTALLPVWAQKDMGSWSVFGGGGYAINPGSGNRNYWTGGVTLTHQIGEHLMVGIEANRQGSDAVGGSAATRLGVGVVGDTGKRTRLLLSAGPTLPDRGDVAVHAFLAIGIDF